MARLLIRPCLPVGICMVQISYLRNIIMTAITGSRISKSRDVSYVCNSTARFVLVVEVYVVSSFSFEL